MNEALETYDVDVIIAGLGPTGLTLAHGLAARGLQVLVLEREPEFYGNARAVYTDGECMRIFQSFGMAEELAKDMLEDVPVNIQLPDGSTLLQIKSTDRRYGWALSNFFYQPALETTLASGLARYPNVRILRGRELIRFEQDEQGVTVFHAASVGSGYGRPVQQPVPGAESRSRARYLVGADGGRSQVRTQLGIKMAGKSFPNPWLVVDLKLKDRADGLRHLPYFSFICDPACPTVNCVQPHGHHRFEFMLMPGQSREHMEDPATVRQYLSRHVDVDKFDILRVLVYTFNALMAERWRDGRILLAGDAAHMTPQFVGQGMNAGVRDAYNLTWKLDAVIRGRADALLLDSYQSERQPHAAAMTREGIRMKDFVSMTNPLATVLRNGMTHLVKRLPVLGRIVSRGEFMPQACYRNGAYFGQARSWWRGPEGRLIPQPSVRGPDGRRHLLDGFLGSGFVVMGIAANPGQWLDEDGRRILRSLDGRCVAVYGYGQLPFGAVSQTVPEDLVELEDVDDAFIPWVRSRGLRSESMLILRPDKFVYAMVAPRQLSSALARLARELHDGGPESSVSGQHALA